MKYELAKKLREAGFLQPKNPDINTQGFYLSKHNERFFLVVRMVRH